MSNRWLNGLITSLPYNDVINVDDIRDAIEEMEDDMEDGVVLDEDEQTTLKAMREVYEEVPDGELLIRDSYFREYAMELAVDCGYMDDEKYSHWPYTCIDWDQAARELKNDYSDIEILGVTYWYHS